MRHHIHFPAITVKHPNYSSRNDIFTRAVLLVQRDIERKVEENCSSKVFKEFLKIEFAVAYAPSLKGDEVVLGRFFPADGVLPPRMIAYRHPTTQKAQSQEISLPEVIASYTLPLVMKYLSKWL
jgi:hypothetical protein